MNRREIITSGIAAAIAAPAAAQSLSFPSPLAAPQETNVYSGPATSEEETKRQHEICGRRGHTPTVFGNMHSYVTNAVFIPVQDRPESPYPNVGASEWRECWYCKTRYRFVTTLEEQS